LEGIARAGGVCISDNAQHRIRGKVDIAFDDIGPQDLKNIAEPMRAWRFRTEVVCVTVAEVHAAGVLDLSGREFSNSGVICIVRCISERANS
jgi:hypothetical protein